MVIDEADSRDENRIDSIISSLEPEKASTQAWLNLMLILLINIGSQWQRFLIAYAAGFEGDIALEHDAPEYEIDKEYPML